VEISGTRKRKKKKKKKRKKKHETGFKKRRDADLVSEYENRKL